MTYVLKLSNDLDIRGTTLSPVWDVQASFTARQVTGGGLNLPQGADILVIAHGNGTEIGDSQEGISFTAGTFIDAIQRNMAHDAGPAAVYLSTCGTGIAEFPANVRINADNRGIWNNVRVFGHHNAISGLVPPPGDIAWTEILHARLRG